METKTKTFQEIYERIAKEIKERDSWIINNSDYLKKGFRETKTFKKIIEGAVQSMADKGWNGNWKAEWGEEPVEVFRPLFEELYLNGCVQGVNGQRITDLKLNLNLLKEIIEAEVGRINEKLKETEKDFNEQRRTKNLSEFGKGVASGIDYGAVNLRDLLKPLQDILNKMEKKI